MDISRIKKLLSGRVLLIAIAIIVQLVFILLVIRRLSYIVYLNYFFNFFTLCLVIYILNKKNNQTFRMSWVILILAFPIIGTVIYLLFGDRQVPKKLRVDNEKAIALINSLYKQDDDIVDKFKNEVDPSIRKMFNLNNLLLFDNTEVEYLSSGEEFFETFIEELLKAQDFILMEYFIFKDGVMWNRIKEILIQKAREGIDIKIIADDFGSISVFNNKNDVELKNNGIEFYRFNRLRPELAVSLNNRDHRKITVIDNKVAFVGGINIGDEYINVDSPYGHWKDSAALFRGAGVFGFTLIFFQIYYSLKDKPINYAKYLQMDTSIKNDTYVSAIFDTPSDNVDEGHNAHLKLINGAREYIYIQTPYLIIDDQIKKALILSASSGVDVRICVPHIPDKKYVFEITRNNYGELIKNGVNIYEYTPGFIHSKSIVVDGIVGMIGTINMDYRSYFHHFECGALIYNSKAVDKMLKDQLETFKISKLISKEDLKINVFRKIYRAILNLVAPLL